MSNYAESDAQLQDWPEKSTNDVVTAMLTRLPQLCWLELNADWPNGIYYHPRLAVNFHLNIDFETLRDLLSGERPWGRDIAWNRCLFRATGETRLKRSDFATGDPPIFVFLDLAGIGPESPFQGPGEFVGIVMRLFTS